MRSKYYSDLCIWQFTQFTIVGDHTEVVLELIEEIHLQTSAKQAICIS